MRYDMNKINKTLTGIGTFLVWFPLLIPFLFSITLFISSGLFRFDFLMPAELFPIELLGGGLLVWAAIRMKKRRRIILSSLFLAAASLIGSQSLAVITGLANGTTKPDGWQWILVLSVLTIYIFSLVALGIGGILLLRDNFLHKNPKKRRE
jgi:hypothetical protein